MTECHLKNTQNVRIAVIVLTVITGLLSLPLLFNISNIYLWFFFAAFLVFLWTERWIWRNSQRVCFEDGCEDPHGGHAVRNCSGRCHSWCPDKKDADLELKDLKVATIDDDDGCSECIYGHEIFAGKKFGPYPFGQCQCSCHRRKKKPIFFCQCHCWCHGRAE